MLRAELIETLVSAVNALVTYVDDNISESAGMTEIDYHDLASAMDYDALAEHVDSYDLACEITNHTALAEDVAGRIDTYEVAEQVGDKIDASDVAEHMCSDAVASSLVDIFLFNHKKVREQAEELSLVRTERNTYLNELNELRAENHPDNPTLGEVVAEMNSKSS